MSDGCCDNFKCVDLAPQGKESYCGIVSLVVGLFLCPCICCCPIDFREKGTGPGTGMRITMSDF